MATTKNSIIYPDDYDGIADVPGDMKKLAESVDENISDLKQQNTKQDINIKTNQKDIKALQEENAEVKAENERLKNDINSISLVGEANGESIDLDDSSNARFNKFEIGGNHKQETREGYNLIGLEQNVKYKVDLKANDYIFATNQTANELRLNLYTNYEDTERNDFWTISANNTRKIQVAQDTKALMWSLPVDGIAWINAGETQRPYEQYGTSPSPDFPSEVETVGGNINIFNKNDVMENAYLNSANGSTLSSSTSVTSNYIEINSNSNYVINGYGTNNYYKVVCYYDKNKNFISSITKTDTSNKLEISAPDGACYLRFHISKNSEEVKLEKGSIITSYSQYNQGSVEVKIVNKNLFDINKITQNTFYWQNYNQIVSNPNWNMSDYIKASKNDDFTISFKQNNSTDTQINYSYYNENKELIGGIGSQTITTTKSFTIIDNQDIKYIRMGYRNDKGMYDIQLEKGSTATDFVEHQEQTITMPVQQEMLNGDYFDWDNEKEVPIWDKKILNGTETNWFLTVFGEAYCFWFRSNTIENCLLEKHKKYCNYFQYEENSYEIASTPSLCENRTGYDTSNFMFIFKTDGTWGKTVEEWKAKLAERYANGTPVIIYYKLKKQTVLDFTDEQKAVAKQIKETLHTYKNVTHIYSDDEISPIVNVEYAKDLNTQNNNLQNQIDEIKQLISTTQTSAMLLDNLQKEVESEVE